MKTAIVTGATSGIGEAAVRAFAGAGWRVIGTGRRADRLDALADEIGRDTLHTIAFDIRDAAERERAVAVCRRAFATSICWSTMPGSRSARRLRRMPSSTTGRR